MLKTSRLHRFQKNEKNGNMDDYRLSGLLRNKKSHATAVLQASRHLSARFLLSLSFKIYLFAAAFALASAAAFSFAAFASLAAFNVITGLRMVAGTGGVAVLLPAPVAPIEVEVPDDAALLKPTWVIFTTPELEVEEDGVPPPPLLPLSLAVAFSTVVVLVVADDGEADLLPEDVDDGSSWVLGPPVGLKSLLLPL